MPSVTDWITAISTGVLAIAAPGSIVVLIRQLRQTQDAAIEERHNNITPHLTLKPLGLAESANSLLQPQTGERVQSQTIAIEAVGNGMASGVYLVFTKSADRFCPQLIPHGFPNLVPGKPEIVTISWIEAIPSDDADEPTDPATYHLSAFFSNALGRLYTQAYDLMFYRSTAYPATLDVYPDEWLTAVVREKENWIRLLLQRLRRESD